MNAAGNRLSHADLVVRASRWLRYKAGCAVVLTELVSSSWEIPDAIGWRGSVSILIECKTSRADFLADAKKPWRIRPDRGLGAHRFFLCPEGVLGVEDLPPGWGLLHVRGRQIVQLAGHPATANAGWGDTPFPVRNSRGETLLLLSALRRVQSRPSAADAAAVVPRPSVTLPISA